MYGIVSWTGKRPRAARAIVTAGLMCAPDVVPNA